INGSTGPNVGATLAAVAGMAGPLVMIAGGEGKNQDFAPLAAAFRGKVRHAVLIGRDAALIARALAGVCTLETCATLPEAVRSAARAALPGHTGQPFYYLERQLLLTLIGACCGALMFSVPTALLERAGVALLALAIGLLAVVLIPGLGHAVNGSRRWLHLAGVNFQVSELSRVLVLVYLASYAVRRETQLRESLAGVLKPLGLLCGVSALRLPADAVADCHRPRPVVGRGTGRQRAEAVLSAGSAHRLPVRGAGRGAGAARGDTDAVPVPGSHLAQLLHRAARLAGGPEVPQPPVGGLWPVGRHPGLHQRRRQHGRVADQGPDAAADELRPLEPDRGARVGGTGIARVSRGAARATRRGHRAGRDMSRPILIMAGGTGGHVFPALALARLLREQSLPVIWLGTTRGLESRVIPAEG